MRLLIVPLLLAGVALMPFVVLRRPWALRLWRQGRLFLLLYVAALIVATVVALIFRWDEIYG